jgi:hypothetical protein
MVFFASFNSRFSAIFSELSFDKIFSVNSLGLLTSVWNSISSFFDGSVIFSGFSTVESKKFASL